MPRDFFERHVKPNYALWQATLLEEHLAKNAVAEANNMAAHVFHYWKNRDRSEVYGARSEAEYRDELAKPERTPDFGLVRDVADGHKHVELTRPSRVTRSDQTQTGSLAWGQGGFGEGVYGGGPQLVITLDDGSKRALSAVMKNVMEMWKQLLVQMEL